MAFSISTITQGPTPFSDGKQILLTWASSSADGTVFQVYQDGRLVWFGTSRRCFLIPPVGRAVYVVGAVGDGEGPTDFSASIPVPGGSGGRVTLTWLSGTYQSAKLGGFNVYTDNGTGTIDYSTKIGRVPALPQDIPMDGFGCGGFGLGGFGLASSSYTWMSSSLGPGTYLFGIKSYTTTGTEGTATTVSATVTAPPLSPTPFADGSKLDYTYNSSTHVAALSWNTPGTPGGVFGTLGMGAGP